MTAAVITINAVTQTSVFI